MNWFRRAMAVPMGLTALALGWLAYRQGGTGFALACAGVAVLLLALLVAVGRRQQAGLAAGRAIMAGLAGVALLVALALPYAASAPVADEQSLLPSQPYSEQALATARAQGKPVFAYFTADWCLTCKVNEASAIEREATREAFAKAGVVVIKGDWTRRDPAITRYLGEVGAAGVPLYVWYKPGGQAQTLPQVLTPQTLPDLAKASAH